MQPDSALSRGASAKATGLVASRLYFPGMMLVFAVVVLLLLAIFTGAAILKIVRIINWLAVLTVRLAAIMTAGAVAYWLMRPDVDDPAWPALGISLATIIVTGWFLRSQGGSRAHRGDVVGHCAAPTMSPKAPCALDLGWQDASRLLSTSAVTTIRERCDRLLAASDADLLDVALLDWAEFIRHRVPELLIAVGAIVATLTPVERRALLDDLLRDLTAIANEADRRMEVQRRAEHDRLATLRRHIASRTDGATGAR